MYHGMLYLGLNIVGVEGMVWQYWTCLLMTRKLHPTGHVKHATHKLVLPFTSCKLYVVLYLRVAGSLIFKLIAYKTYHSN